MAKKTIDPTKNFLNFLATSSNVLNGFPSSLITKKTQKLNEQYKLAEIKQAPKRIFLVPDGEVLFNRKKGWGINRHLSNKYNLSLVTNAPNYLISFIEQARKDQAFLEKMSSVTALVALEEHSKISFTGPEKNEHMLAILTKSTGKIRKLNTADWYTLAMGEDRWYFLAQLNNIE